MNTVPRSILALVVVACLLPLVTLGFIVADVAVVIGNALSATR